MTQGCRGQVAPVIWSIDFDGKSVFDIMETWQKMPFDHIKKVIANEGGYIDEKGIVHRGSAKAPATVTIS